MVYEMLEQFRRKLFRRKAALLAHRDVLRAEQDELRGEREPDWEDTAATETAGTPLADLAESDYLELRRIRASLDRMARGSYGECAVCHEPIDLARLRAVPDTDRCGGCADRH